MKSVLPVILLLLTFGCIQANNKTGGVDDCNFDKMLNSPQTPTLAKTIFNNKDWDLSTDAPLAFLDSLTIKDKTAKRFYFKVVTESYKNADGYYSEGLGNAGKIYVENNTREFLSYFDLKNCFTDKDLQTWVDILMLEFTLEADNAYKKDMMHNYIKTLESHTANSPTSIKNTLKIFTTNLNKAWEELLKHKEK